MVVWAVAASAALGWSLSENNAQNNRWNATLLQDIASYLGGANGSIQVMLALRDVGYGDGAEGIISAARGLASQSRSLTGSASPMDTLGFTDQAFECVQQRFFYLLAGIGNNSTPDRSSGWGMFFSQSGVYLGRISAALLPIAPSGVEPLTLLGRSTVDAIRSNMTFLVRLSGANTFSPYISACNS